MESTPPSSMTTGPRWVIWGTLVPVHDRLSRTIGLELCLVQSPVNHVQLSAVDDERILAWGGSLWFKASAVYRMIKLSSHELPLHDLNWDGFMPVKVKVFAWVIRHGKTHTRDFLHRIGFPEHDYCPFCPGRPETIMHLFLECPRLQPMWAHVLGRHGKPVIRCVENVWRAFTACHPSWSGPLLSTMMCRVLLVVWKTRNRMVFNNIRVSDLDLWHLIQEHLRLWVVRAPSRVDYALSRLCGAVYLSTRCL